MTWLILKCKELSQTYILKEHWIKLLNTRKCNDEILAWGENYYKYLLEEDYSSNVSCSLN